MSGGAAGSALCAYAGFVEKWRVEVTETRIPLPGLAKPVRLTQLSDLHLGRAISLDHLHHVATLALATKPDLFCLTGDYVDYPDVGYDVAYRAVFRRLSQAAPTFATLGNHDGSHHHPRPGEIDHTVIRARLSAGGVHLLHNDAAQQVGLNLVGVGDLWSWEVDPERAFHDTASGLPTILMNHNPDAKDALLPYPWQLMLSGHTHGNQIRVPFLGRHPWAVVQDPRFIAGHYHWEGRQMYINRGIGGLSGIRLNSRPEVSVLRLEPVRLTSTPA